MKISDKDLEQAAKKVCSSLSEELPAISNEPFSPAFEEKMEQLLRTEHQNKRWKVFARNTAAIVVVLLTLGGSILLLNTEARALTLS